MPVSGGRKHHVTAKESQVVDDESKAAGGAQPMLRQLLRYIRPYSLKFGGGALLILLGASAALAQPMVARHFLNALTAAEPVDGVLMLLVALLIGGAVLTAVGLYLIDLTAEGIVLSVRKRLVSRLVRLRPDFVDHTHPGELLSRMTADTTLLRSATTRNLIDVLVGFLQLAGMLSLMAYLDLTLVAVVLGVLLLVLGIALALTPRIRHVSQAAQESVGLMGARLERLLGAFRTVKANGVEEQEAKTISAVVDNAYAKGLRASRLTSLAGASSSLIIQISFLIVLAVGGMRAASNDLSMPDLVAFLLYLFYLTGPIAQLTGGLTGLQVGAAAIQRLHEVDLMPIELDENSPREGAGRVDPISRDIEGEPGFATVVFRDVQVQGRRGGRPTLDGVSFELPAPGLTAVVGPSGAGKSTILEVLERFRDFARGSVEVAGRNIRDWPLTELRRLISYVEQDAPVLAGSLRENITMGADVGDEDLNRIISQVRLESLASRLPEGLDSSVGHRGVMLSGGERQRIAIARALVRRPRILLLDEITSQLDTVNETALQDVVASLSSTTAVIVVAHRMSTLTAADRTLVMESGRLRAVGTHADLMLNDDLYRRLATGQGIKAEDPLMSGSIVGRS